MREFEFDPSQPAPLVRAILAGPKGAFHMRLILDTGAHSTQLSKAAMHSMGFNEDVSTRDAYSIGVGGAREKGFEVIVSRFFVLGAKFQDVAVCAFNMKYLEGEGADGLLGWDLISQLHLEMDGPKGLLRVF